MSKIYFVLLLVLLAITGCSSSKNLSDKTTQAKRVQLVEYAHNYLGKPYKYGGTTPNGFDCSGFCYFIFKRFGYDLPRSSSELGTIGNQIKRKELQPGDLVFFKGSNALSKSIGHVGIVTRVDKKRFYFIHAATSEGITISSINQKYYHDRYLQARSIFKL